MFKPESPASVATQTGRTTKPFNLRTEKGETVFEYKPTKTLTQQEKAGRHAIYDRLLSLLEGKGFAPPFILHRAVKFQLKLDNKMTDAEISKLENQIFRDAAVLRPASSIPRGLSRELVRTCGNNRAIFDKRIVRVPDEELNLMICSKLKKNFPRAAILRCPGFILSEGLFLRLDIDERLAEHGFLLPKYYENGMIAGLKIYRHFKDNQPFVLRSRKNGGLA